MGTGNNIGIKESKTEYVLILNPDVILEKNTIEELFVAAKELSDFTILAPLEINYKNYGKVVEKEISKNNSKNLPF